MGLDRTRRKLWGPEKAWTILDQVAPSNVVRLVRFDRRLELERLRAAIKLAEADCPVLATGIAGGYLLRFEEALDVQVVRVAAAQAPAWCAKELAQALPSEAPRIRFHLHRCDRGDALAMVYHHGITDGAGGLFALHRVLQCYADPDAVRESVQPVPTVRTSRRWYPRETTAWAFDEIRHRGGMLRHAAAIARRGTIVTTPVFFRVPRSRTSRVVDDCRDAGVSSHAYLLAAIARSSTRVKDAHEVANAGMLSFVDLRRRQEPTLSVRAVGCWIAAVKFFQTVAPACSLLTLAARVEKELEHCIRHDMHWAAAHWAPVVARGALRFNQRMAASVAASTLGRLPLSARYGELVTTETYGCSAANALTTDFTLNSGILNGELFGCISYPSPYVAEETAALFMRELLTALEVS